MNRVGVEGRGSRGNKECENSLRLSQLGRNCLRFLDRLWQMKGRNLDIRELRKVLEVEGVAWSKRKFLFVLVTMMLGLLLIPFTVHVQFTFTSTSTAQPIADGDENGAMT